jgi:DNA-binding NtrC family response regulator
VLNSGINTPSSRITISLDQVVAQAEIDSIIQALKLSEGNKQEAARILGIHVSGLYQKLKKYNITGH